MSKTDFERLRVYQLAENLGDQTWFRGENFAKDTLGKQLVRAADSIGANIAEGTGRGSYTDNRRFAKIARASLFGVKHWLIRAYKRNLLNEEEIASFQQLVQELLPKISAYINSIGRNGTAK